MKTLELNRHLFLVASKKVAIGYANLGDPLEDCRNSGARRTDRKRETLKRAEARAKAAGVQPVTANY